MGYLEIVKQALAAAKKAQGPELAPGAWIEWDSPVFGRCRGQVAVVEGDRILIEDHHVTHGYHGPAWICLDWVVRNDGEKPRRIK